jgi:hypothetical protein
MQQETAEFDLNLQTNKASICDTVNAGNLLQFDLPKDSAQNQGAAALKLKILSQITETLKARITLVENNQHSINEAIIAAKTEKLQSLLRSNLETARLNQDKAINNLDHQKQRLQNEINILIESQDILEEANLAIELEEAIKLLEKCLQDNNFTVPQKQNRGKVIPLFWQLHKALCEKLAASVIKFTSKKVGSNNYSQGRYHKIILLITNYAINEASKTQTLRNTPGINDYSATDAAANELDKALYPYPSYDYKKLLICIIAGILIGAVIGMVLGFTFGYAGFAISIALAFLIQAYFIAGGAGIGAIVGGLAGAILHHKVQRTRNIDEWQKQRQECREQAVAKEVYTLSEQLKQFSFLETQEAKEMQDNGKKNPVEQNSSMINT